MQATFESAVRRFFVPPPDEREIPQFLGEFRRMFGSDTPDIRKTEAVIRAALGDETVSTDDVGVITRAEICGLVASFIVRRLGLPEAAIDELILEGERIALERGWHPMPAS